MKNKYVDIGVGLVVIIGLAVGTVLVVHVHKAKGLSLGAASINADATPTPSTSNSDSSSLNVSSSSQATNLGQLGSSQQSSGGNPTGQGAPTSSGSGSNQGLDPSTFSQYDKYKADTNALFGDIQVGSGAELAENHQAEVVYKGWLTNGQLFDESHTGSDGKLQPFVFTDGAHQVIPGWEQGLTGMKVGGTRLLIVPPTVGYGATGQGSIPPNSVLVFEVQLVAVQ